MSKSTQESIVKTFCVAAERAGVKGFVLGLEDDGLVTTHLEKIPMNSVSRIVIALFSQMCDFESSQGQMSKEYRDAMVAMKGDFLEMVKTYNKRFEEIRNSGKTKTN